MRDAGLFCSMSREAAGEDGVSEVIGVVLMLSMVISIMATVFTVLAPYLSDINAARSWSALTTNAGAIEERISTAADAANGSVFILPLQLDEGRVVPLLGTERWTITADLFGNERVEMVLNGTFVEFSSVNGTMRQITITGAGVNQVSDVDDLRQPIRIDIGNRLPDLMIIDIHDHQNMHIHRLISVSIDGLRITSSIGGSTYSIDLVNGAMIQTIPNEAPVISQEPRMRCELLNQNHVRASVALLDLNVSALTSLTRISTLRLQNQGNLALFDDVVRNLDIRVTTTERSIATSTYISRLSDEHALYQSIGIENLYTGFGPVKTSSKTLAITAYPLAASVEFSLSLQTVGIIE